MPLLVVRQAVSGAGDDPARFLLLREDGKSLPEPVAVPAAHGFAVEERPKSDLMAELRWYLENFLEYPFPPETGRAERVLRALRSWGEAAFEALFGDRVGGGFWAAATASGYERLRLQIRSDDPAVPAWPWEALHDPLVGPLGPLCQIERRLDAVGDPPPLAAGLPRDRVHILLVTARPYEQDVAYRTVSRPLVELIARERLPADVHLLRPPRLRGASRRAVPFRLGSRRARPAPRGSRRRQRPTARSNSASAIRCAERGRSRYPLSGSPGGVSTGKSSISLGKSCRWWMMSSIAMPSGSSR